MTTNRTRLNRLARRLDERAPALPFLILSYGLEGDLYLGQNRSYTADELTELETRYQLIIVSYGEWPPDKSASVIQLRWPEDDGGENRPRDVAPGRA